MLFATAANAAVKDDSYKDANGDRVLREWIIVAAPRAEVWKAFTTDEGFAKWAAPVVHITPGNGGLMEFGLGPKGRIGDPNNVRHRILVYLPDELLIFRNEFVPAGGPIDPVAFGQVRTLLSFDDAGNGTTRVTETVVGFGSDAMFDALYDHLRGGNAEYLTLLANSFHPKN
jgi:uncharacterized protein YndB with AHSA1/START domain